MGYRGEDLDLRTPQTWSTSAADLSGGGSGEGRGRYGAGPSGRAGPIWVDETVLAACNHAFDVALAHRAGEVTLEHLLHALTRIDDAAEALEARGVRVTALRRETATIIASEIPIGLPNGKGAPRRSEEMEEALRLAAAGAARRDAPATVDDLIRAMLDVRPDLPGLQPPLRAPSRQTASYYDAPPLISRAGYAYDAGEPVRERGRPMAPIEPRAARAEGVSVQGYAQSASRLDALEQLVRALSNDLASERKAITGVLQELQREVAVQRDDMGRHAAAGGERLQSDITERLQGIERSMAGLRPAAPVDLAPVIERLGAVERAMGTPAPHADLSPLTSRLDMIEEVLLSQETAGLNEMLARLKALEEGFAALEHTVSSERVRAAEAQAGLVAEIREMATAVGRQPQALTSAMSPLSDRLDAVAAKLAGQMAGAETSTRNLDSRIAALGEATATAAKRADEVQASHVQELKELHEAVMKLNSNQHTLAASIDEWRRDSAGQVTAVADKLSLIGAGVSTLTGNVSGLGTRLETVERESAKPIAMLENVTGTVEKMHKITVERYYRRNRFWYWLFGTDDWVAASWPSQAARIVEDLKLVRNAPAAASPAKK